MKSLYSVSTLPVHASRKGMRFLITAALLMLCLSSCGLMEEDRTDCPTGLYLTFIYDYNLEEENRIDQLSSLLCYVIDEAGKVAACRRAETVEGGVKTSFFGYVMHFPELPPGHYRLMAIGGGSPSVFSRSEDMPLFRLLPANFGVGSDIRDLRIRLDRDTGPTQLRYWTKKDGQSPITETTEAYAVGPQSSPLDSLWLPLNRTADNRTGKETMEDFLCWEVRDQRPTYATAYLMRITKQTFITIREKLPTGKEPARYEAYITAGNGDFDAATHPVGTQRLLYRPFEKDQRVYAQDSTRGTVPHTTYPLTSETRFILSHPRLYLHDEAKKDATLYIIDTRTGKAVVRENLPRLLVSYREVKKPMKYPPQEVLDRIHEYSLEFSVADDQWKQVDINLRLLRWENHPQDIDFQ